MAPRQERFTLSSTAGHDPGGVPQSRSEPVGTVPDRHGFTIFSHSYSSPSFQQMRQEVSWATFVTGRLKHPCSYGSSVPLSRWQLFAKPTPFGCAVKASASVHLPAIFAVALLIALAMAASRFAVSQTFPFRIASRHFCHAFSFDFLKLARLLESVV